MSAVDVSPKISIIVPVYNVEKYLPKTLDSLISQTLTDIEIICIDDESPDNCGKILDEYANRDTRIKVIHQKNSGQGSARNRGLEIARGKYIQFLDSDDYYEPTCCEEMYNIMEENKNINIATFDTNITYDAFEDKKEGDYQYFKMHFEGIQRIKPYMLHQIVDCNCWNKIFRKTFIDIHGIKFPEKLHYEDVAFFWSYMTRVENIYFYRKKLTNYLRREGSFLGEIYTKSSKSIFDAFKVNELIYEDLIKNNKYETYKSVFLRSYVTKFNWLINCFTKDKFDKKKELIDMCADFLLSVNLTGADLNENEEKTINMITSRNYYVYNAFQRYETEDVTPAYNNSINVVFSVDKNYAPYLSVTITSIIENSKQENNYDIVILYSDLYDHQKKFLLSQIINKNNITIRFFNISEYIKSSQLDKLFKRNDMTSSVYYRLFIGKIFYKYEKIIYLDCDIILTRDIADLFNIDIANYPVGACIDINIANHMYNGVDNKKFMEGFREYMRNQFGFHNSRQYFNSGVLLINIKEYNKFSFDVLLELARKNTKYFHDQNVLNVAFAENYFQLDPKWNIQAHIVYYSKFRTQLPGNIVSIYESRDELPYIIHFTSHPKVWLDCCTQWANIWWQYARKSPFYEIILKKYIDSSKNAKDSTRVEKSTTDKINTKMNRIRKFRYKILSKITFGKTRQRYKEKYKAIKQDIKN